jgi:hypothetical protein
MIQHHKIFAQTDFNRIEIALPSLGYLDVVEKSFLGASGAMLLLEQILNGLRFIYG